jgi:hypothetical protein
MGQSGHGLLGTPGRRPGAPGASFFEKRGNRTALVRVYLSTEPVVASRTERSGLSASWALGKPPFRVPSSFGGMMQLGGLG